MAMHKFVFSYAYVQNWIALERKAYVLHKLSTVISIQICSHGFALILMSAYDLVRSYFAD